MKITYRGWAGHFICSTRCRFHLNTLIEHNGYSVVVSTVGNFYAKPEDRKPDTIGADRHYETMAFEGVKENEYIEADVSKPVYFDSDWAWKITKENEDVIDNIVTEGHNAVVEEIKQRMLVEYS